MRQKYLLSFFGLRNVFILLGYLFIPFLSFSQIMNVYPQVDTLSLWGTCTPPEVRCTLKNVGQGTDRIVIYPYAAELICGLPLGHISARYDSAYFLIRDSLQLNRYEIFYSNLSIYHTTRFRLPFDSTIYSYSGPCKLTLRVLRNAIIVDSAVLSFDSYQTGLGVGDDLSIIPEEICLVQNYPNPFNPSTTISYFIPKASQVRIEVFDLLGHQIDILVNKFQHSGNYLIQWEPRIISSGTYFIILTSGIKRAATKCQYLN